jgi:hypothetical protein
MGAAPRRTSIRVGSSYGRRQRSARSRALGRRGEAGAEAPLAPVHAGDPPSRELQGGAGRTADEGPD